MIHRACLPERVGLCFVVLAVAMVAGTVLGAVDEDFSVSEEVLQTVGNDAVGVCLRPAYFLAFGRKFGGLKALFSPVDCMGVRVSPIERHVLIRVFPVDRAVRLVQAAHQGRLKLPGPA